MKLCPSIILIMFLVVVSLSSNAAEVKVIKGDNLMIDGKIERGDYKKLVDTVLKYGKIPSGVAITSPGGDVIEAIKIGRFIRKNHLWLFVIQPCDSACAFIVFAAVTRKGKEFGLHRPFYDPEYFANLSGYEANIKYQELDVKVRKYLTEMNVPTIIIDKIMSISSSDIERMELSAYDKVAGEYPPAHYEWLAARCGSFEKNERKDYMNVMTLVSRKKHPDVELDPESLTGKLFQYRIDAASKLPSGYRNYIYKKGIKIVDCEDKAIEEERKSNYKELTNLQGH